MERNSTRRKLQTPNANRQKNPKLQPPKRFEVRKFFGIWDLGFGVLAGLTLQPEMPFCCASSRVISLCQQTFCYFAVLDDFYGPAPGHKRFFEVNAEQMIDGGRVVLHVERIGVRLTAGGISGAVDAALLDAAACH